MKKLLALLLALPVLAWAAGGAKTPLDRAPVNLHDRASLQRGAQIFVNHCLNCHAASAMRYGKLTDLGLARDTSDKQAAESEAGKAYGTPYYISPEQIRGEVDIDHRADIYSLGATLYHLITGRPPFDGDTPSAVMHKHLKDPLVPPDHINQALGAGISEICEMAMSKARQERYSTMDEMLEDLRLVRAGEAPVHARRAIDFGSLAQMEQAAHTVDYDPPAGESGLWDSPAFIGTLIVAAASVVVNVILLVLILAG